MKTDNPYKLVKKLDNYSEMGEEYGEKLSSMIKYNKFYLYDR
jgi:Bax protein